MKYEIIKNQDP